MDNISPTLKSKLIVQERKSKGLPIYNGGLGENNFHVHYRLLETAINNLCKKNYTNIEGEDSFKLKIKNFIKLQFINQIIH